MKETSLQLVAQGDYEWIQQIVILVLVGVSAVGSAIVGKLRERKEKKDSAEPVVPPPTPEQRELGRTQRPAAKPQRPQVTRSQPARTARPPRPQAASTRTDDTQRARQRQRARAILLGEEVPVPAIPVDAAEHAQSVAQHAEAIANARPSSHDEEQPLDVVLHQQEDHSGGPPPAAARKRPRIRLNRGNLRQAIIHAEVLGRPIGDRSEHL